MKYKKGDSVRVRKDLKGGSRYALIFFNPRMEKYLGQVAKIVKVKGGHYWLDIDDGDWRWTSKMLTSAERTLEDLRVGDIIGRDETRAKVLSVSGEVFVISLDRNFDSASDINWTVADLRGVGFELVQDKPKKKVIAVDPAREGADKSIVFEVTETKKGLIVKILEEKK